MTPQELREHLFVLVQVQFDRGLPEFREALMRMREDELRIGNNSPFQAWRAIWTEMERHSDESRWSPASALAALP